MKTKTLFSIIIGLTLLSGLSSCALDEDYSGMSSPYNFFRSYTECQQIVNGCYIPLKSIFTFRFLIVTEACNDLFHYSTTWVDARLDISPASPGFGATIWTQSYLGVQRCNFAVQGIEEAYARGDIGRDDYYQILCEAKALRGYYYWILTCVFGNVPFYLEDVSDNEVLQRIQRLPRMDAGETRDALIDDLLSIAPYAPQTRTSDNEDARVGASLAYMLVAKFAQWNEEWNVAIDALKNIEQIYGDLSQYSYKTNAQFRNRNTSESIFEIQNIYAVGGVSSTGNVACMCMPYPKTQGTAIYDGVEISEIGDEATCWGPTKTNAYFTQTVQPKTDSDIRTAYNMAWEYNGEAFASVTASACWLGPKFWRPDLKSSSDGNNYKQFRYADAILMMSECYCQIDDYDNSVKYLNMVRNRAGTGAYGDSTTKSRLLSEIQKERARELFGEFQRKFDLVRWGIWYDQTSTYSDYSYLNLGHTSCLIKPCHRYYPIPETEVILSGGALDNDEYRTYGL